MKIPGAAWTLALTLAVAAAADTLYPPAGWTEKPNPFASPDALPGGELRAYAGPYPKSLNYYLDNNSFSADLFSLMFESLLTLNPLTLDYEPGLAERWSISDDRRTFTFWLNPKARWSDGRPVTAHDVAWTWEAIVSPTNLTGPHKVALEVFDPPVVSNDLQIAFTAREVHWRNLGAIGGFAILPRHVHATQDFNKVNFEFPVVSGPYRLAAVRENLDATLERRADWWLRAAPGSQGVANFDRLTFRFFGEQENAFDAFRKGELDLYAVYTARLWVNETTGPKFDNHWIARQKVVNYNPIGFQGFAMNLRRPLFQDVRVRRALACLLDRATLNATLMYNQYFLHRSYFEDLYPPATPCTNTNYAYDPDKARTLLHEAGWTVNPKTGWMEKDGRRLTVRFLTRDSATDKFLAIYAESLKNAGVELVVDQKDWAAWARDMDVFNFDMTWAAWSASIFKDPEGMWASREADRQGSSNLTGFRDPDVDALIEKQKTLFDVAERHAVCREIDRRVTDQVPYILLWNINYTRLLYWNRFGTPPTVLGKYGNESAAYTLWWHDPDAAADLQDAVARGLPLPAKPETVRFDDLFKP